MKDTKPCPFCGEIIKISAIKCKYCGSVLSGSFGSQISSDTQVKLALSEKYDIIEVVAKGGMATVYKAVQRNLNRIVALKVVHPNLLHDTEFLNRFHREAQTAASLSHPNIVMIYDEGSLNGVHFIAMEYLDGKDLHCIIKERGKLSVDETINIIIPIAEALDYAHSRGLIHRDVKSANIIVTQNGRTVLTDFGIAHAASGTKLTQAGSIIGTPEYMSPEQAEGKIVDGRSDIFSLGIVMYECLTGKVPFKGDNPLTTIHGIIYDSTPSPRVLNGKIPGWLETIVMCTLSKIPDERFPSGIILSAYLLERKTPSGTFKKVQRKTLTLKPAVQTNKIFSTNRAIIGLIILSVIIIIATIFIYITQESSQQKPAVLTNVINNDLTNPAGPRQDLSELINEGARLFNEGRLNEARLKYKEALGIEPANSISAAKIKEIDDIISKRNEIGRLTISADRSFERNELSNARSDYARILETDKQNQHATQQIAVIDRKLRERARDQNEANFVRYISYADSLFNLEHYDRAKTFYENARKIKPGDKHVKDRLESIGIYLTNNEAEFDGLMDKVNINIKSGKLSLAREQLLEAQTLKPGDPRIAGKLDSLGIIVQSWIQNEINNNLVYVEGGQFIMGTEIADDDQRPSHKVKLSTFYIDKYEVSVKQFRLFCEVTGRSMPRAPNWGWKDNYPIVNVKWDDAAAYARWAGKRLPTEAEWEYAALGGKKSNGAKYSGSNDANSVANYERSSGKRETQSIDSKNPNELGIYNMSGNVWELCSDFYAADYYKNSESDNPKGPYGGTFRVIRGGAWNSPTKEILIKNRAYNNGKYVNNVGFRCVKD